MIDHIFNMHVERLRTALLRTHKKQTIAKWICDNTVLMGEPFSFKDHEYQYRIMQSVKREKVIRKCSQTGITELALRWHLGLLQLHPGTSCAYTLPTSSFASEVAKTRCDPIIVESPPLKETIDKNTDNTTVKRFGTSFLYFIGTYARNATISRPIDFLVHDEVDFSNIDTMSTYQSRLTHSKFKWKLQLSTPTVSKFGVSALFDDSNQHFNFVKCNHCNHYFIPDYFEHVVLPKWTRSLREITKEMIARMDIDLQSAYVKCPNCDGVPNLQPKHREWVCANPEHIYDADGFQINPFDAPNVITCGDLIRSSMQYSRYTEFINNNLGLPAEDKETTLSRKELEHCFIKGEPMSSPVSVMGVDLGKICHILIGAIDPTGAILITHTLQCQLADLEMEMKDLSIKHRVILTVMDSHPYTDLVLRLQRGNLNLYGAVYVTKSQDIDIFKVKTQEEDAIKARNQVLQVNINRDKVFDVLMDFIRSGGITIVEDVNKEKIITHCTDMKRVKDYRRDELVFTWKKSQKGDDHFWHTMAYLFVASMMRGAAVNSVILPIGVRSFRHKPIEETEQKQTPPMVGLGRVPRTR